jgi:rubrerythrin
MSEPTTDIERVKLALTTENDGTSFYEYAATRTANKLARAAFEMLSKEEIRHVSLVKSLGQMLEGRGELAEPDSPTEKDLAKKVHTIYSSAQDEAGEGDLDPGEAYAKAIELEKKIAALYFGYAQDCESGEARHLFDVLYREEQDHLGLLEDMHGYLTRPDDWFIDRDMVMLDGG